MSSAFHIDSKNSSDTLTNFQQQCRVTLVGVQTCGQMLGQTVRFSAQPVLTVQQVSRNCHVVTGTDFCPKIVSKSLKC